MKERGEGIERAGIESIEAVNILIRRTRAVLDLEVGPLPDAATEELGVQTEEPLSHDRIYERLLTSFEDNPVFRSVGEILEEFTMAGYLVTRNQIRGAIEKGLGSRSVIKLSYTSSRRYVWYGLPEWVRADPDGVPIAFAVPSAIPDGAQKLSTQIPDFSFD